jgi:cysteine desulfurase
MHANNEVGTIEPIAEIAEAARKRGILTHTDAAQTVGKFPFRVQDLGVDLLSVAGHKLYAPKGVGALYARKGVSLTPLIHGAGHESGRRAGTENTAAVVGLGCACALQLREEAQNTEHMRRERDRLHERILTSCPEVVLNGHPELRLPNTLSLAFPGVRAPDIIRALPDVAVSAGAACHAEGVTASHVLEAMGLPLERSLGTLRFSTGHFTTKDEVEEAADRLIRVLQDLKKA